MKRYIRSSSNAAKYIVVLQNGELLKDDKGRIMQLNDEVITTPADTLHEASRAVKDYIHKMNLGSSTFTGGQVLDARTHKQVARISYNGRIWDMQDDEITDVNASSDLVVDEWDDLTDAILNGKPYDYDRFHEYWQAFHQPEEGAIRADQVKVGDILRNTEDASEINIGDEFRVNEISRDEDAIGDYITFDFVFRVSMLSGDYKGTECDLHYMKDEYVGVPVQGVSASTRIRASKKVSVSTELRSILEDVMIDTLDNYSGSHILNEFVENARYLQSWDEYDEEHSEEMLELSRLSNNKLVDIGAEILDEVKAGWQGDEL